MLPKTIAYAKKIMMVELNGCILIEDGDFLKKYNNIWDDVSAYVIKNLITNLLKI